ncbi:hypothetical protein HOK22_01930 [Candidatus Peregrinibacteria bacterium]|nr:hypothetical protein [Candidatus Peregrinibacteria bacterium]
MVLRVAIQSLKTCLTDEVDKVLVSLDDDSETEPVNTAALDEVLADLRARISTVNSARERVAQMNSGLSLSSKCMEKVNAFRSAFGDFQNYLEDGDLKELCGVSDESHSVRVDLAIPKSLINSDEILSLKIDVVGGFDHNSVMDLTLRLNQATDQVEYSWNKRAERYLEDYVVNGIVDRVFNCQ